MDYNPYAPTKGSLSGSPASAAESGHGVDAQPASRWRRLTNLLIDTLGFLLLSGVCGIVLEIAKLLFHVDMLASMGGAYGIFVLVLYYLGSEALFGRTLGKLVTHTRVVSESGGPATFWQLLMRTLYRLIPFEGFSFLATRRPGWHDRWSKTRVVLTRVAEPPAH